MRSSARLLAVALVVSACSSSGGYELSGTTAAPVGATTATGATGSSGAPDPTGAPAPSSDTGVTTSAAGRTATSTLVSSGAVLPPGSRLPDDATCAARVAPAAEIRPSNAAFNATRGKQKGLSGRFLSRVTGDYAGTTDEILQWAACKWGVDPDLVRAQAAKESQWYSSTYGDFATDPAVCPPGHEIGKDGKNGQCPESIGILQVRYQYHGPPAGLATWPEAETSTAYNVDYAYAVWRTCFEGDWLWLNEQDRVGTYGAGDAWGCVGVWFAGRWHTSEAEGYIGAVKANAASKIWRSSSFLRGR
jgi:hypothetical protein